MSKQIRWKQRFQNFEDAFLFLKESAAKPSYSVLEEAGIIQCFEFTFELAWKTMRDYLESKGVLLQYPRDVIKEAFSSGLLSDGHTWIDMLEERNTLAHTYNKKQADAAVTMIKTRFLPAIEQAYTSLKKCLD